MAKPVIFTVDDEPTVLNAIERDLRKKFGRDYRILKADSGAAALESLRQLQLRNEPTALFLADQRMPHMTGVQFLEQARALYPDARRVLLTAYADTEAAINAINRVALDYYLMKPWDPPEERLYPILQDLLDDWSAAFRPPFEGIRIVGNRWSPAVHSLKDFLARNQIPYQSLDVEADEQARQLVDALGPTTPLPVVLFPDGTHLAQPTNVQLAEKIGLKTRAGMPFYDLIIVGGGPAGLAASVYAASEGLRTLLIEKDAPGGQAGTSARIENYLGFPVGLSGADLARRAVAQATRFGVEILTPAEATSLRIKDVYRIINLSNGSAVSSHALLIASGVSYRRLDIPGIDRLAGAGVYYGSAVTEGMACRDKEVFIVGGGNSAGQAALYLSKYARGVTILVRGESLSATMSQYLIDAIRAAPNITVRPRTTVIEVHGETNLATVTLCDAVTGETQTLPASALFIFIGALPRTEWVSAVVACDEHGFIPVGGPRPPGWPLDRDPFVLETNVPGIFAAGDVRQQAMNRIASAVGEGAMAVSFVHRYLATL
ncbi:MAG TPA: FAD-dependent oxidoreductase [Anaerolineae bacterium]|nr:FAD-dependent oxidoreductase [Anaerolineae bacterium]